MRRLGAHAPTKVLLLGLNTMMPMLKAAPASGQRSRSSVSTVGRSWSAGSRGANEVVRGGVLRACSLPAARATPWTAPVDVRMSASGKRWKKGTGLRSHAVSMSEMTTVSVLVISRNLRIRLILALGADVDWVTRAQHTGRCSCWCARWTSWCALPLRACPPAHLVEVGRAPPQVVLGDARRHAPRVDAPVGQASAANTRTRTR